MRTLGKIKAFLFPVKKSELKTFALSASLMFCILFNMGALRSIKDSLVVSHIGPESISFLKLWVILPVAVAFTIIYVRLSNSLNAKQMFTCVVLFFIGCYVFFAFLIFPHQHYYHPSAQSAAALEDALPQFKWFIKLGAKWSYVCFYALGELWGAMVVNLMFWQFLNHIFSIDQAKRLYPGVCMLGNLGLVFTGGLLMQCTECLDGSAISTMQISTAVIAVSGCISIVLFRAIYNNHITTKYLYHEETRTTLSIKDSFYLIKESKYVLYIGLMVICYNFTLNILEGPWKAKISQLYNTQEGYLRFMGQFNVWMGALSVLFAVLGSTILRRISWLGCAYITPIMIALTGGAFFIFVVCDQFFESLVLDPLYFAVMIGAAQNILSKSSKYSIFDSVKEIAYIPLNRELRTKGKAAVEVVFAKFGKSSGALVQFIVFTIFPSCTFDDFTSILMVIFWCLIFVWIIDVRELNKRYCILAKST